MKKAIILGGGIGGLSAAWMLARTGAWHVTVIEKRERVGGVCGTFQHGPFRLDYGPHKLYSVLPGILDEFKGLMGGELRTVEKKNSIYLFHAYLRYPLAFPELIRRMGVANILRVALSLLPSMLSARKPAISYEDYIVARFGRQLYRLVFEPLADKTWGDPATISADIARTRLPSSSFVDVALRLLKLRQETGATDARHFYYPPSGFGRIAERLAEAIAGYGGEIAVSSTVEQVNLRGQTIAAVTIAQGGQRRKLDADLVVSAIPVREMAVYLAAAGLPEGPGLTTAAARLQYRQALLVYLAVDAPRLTADHWMFFPEREIVFGRVFEQKNLSADMAPADRTVIGCDFTDFPNGPLASLSDDQLAEHCIRDLRIVGILKNTSVREHFVVRLPDFYPRYDLNYKTTFAEVLRGFRACDNLLLTGRVGFYNYNNADHCLDMGRFIGEQVTSDVPPRLILDAMAARVAGYRIVD